MARTHPSIVTHQATPASVGFAFLYPHPLKSFYTHHPYPHTRIQFHKYEIGGGFLFISSPHSHASSNQKF